MEHNLVLPVTIVVHKYTRTLFGIPWILAINFNILPGVSFCQRKLSALSTTQHTRHENLKLSYVLGYLMCWGTLNLRS
ncbi:hypothetical protein GJ496_002592 [Pomphorhynchus laevis]|nr:hypothetical protein GJ496_002592 [Pomphorhynchus laevis]